MIAALFHGDPKTKIGKVFDVVKQLWSSSDSTNEQINQILNDDTSKSKFEEFYDIIKDTRVLKTILKIVKTIDFSEFNAETIKLADFIRNPESPELKSIVDRMIRKVQDHIQRSGIRPQDFQREIEMIKARAITLFGSMFGDMLSGGAGETRIPSHIMMGNSPEARMRRIGGD
jgi:hypothetical protein